EDVHCQEAGLPGLPGSSAVPVACQDASFSLAGAPRPTWTEGGLREKAVASKALALTSAPPLSKLWRCDFSARTATSARRSGKHVVAETGRAPDGARV